MKGFKKWLTDKFLPAWAKETVLEELKKAQNENEALRRENEQMSTYIRGLESGIRAQRRIVIYTGSGRVER